MVCKRIPNGYICVAGDYKVGDPEPSGYLDRFEWAEVHRKAGIKQVRCTFCGRFFWTTEKHNCSKN